MECALDDSQLLPDDITAAMCHHLLQHHREDLEQILADANVSVAKHHSVAVDCRQLMLESTTLCTLLLHHPTKFQPHVDAAVYDAQVKLQEQAQLEQPPPENLWSWTAKESCHLRLHRLPFCPELRKATVSMLRSSDLSRLISVSGTVIRTGLIKLLHTRREYKCVKCGHTFSVDSNFETRNEMDMPLECPSEGLAAKACGGWKFEMVEGSETCRDYQEVRIQEQVRTGCAAATAPDAPPPPHGMRSLTPHASTQVHKLSVGSIPRSISLALFDDLVDRVRSPMRLDPEGGWGVLGPLPAVPGPGPGLLLGLLLGLPTISLACRRPPRGPARPPRRPAVQAGRRRHHRRHAAQAP